MLEKTDKAVFSNDEIVFAIVGYGNVTVLIDGMGLVDFDDEYPDDYPNIIHVRLMAWFNRYK